MTKTAKVNLDIHKVAAIFPVMEDAEIKRLAADIKTNGLHHPITLFEGKILDGRNRYLACQQAGVEPKTVQWQGTLIEAIEFVWSENFYRRHLSSSQAAACFIERERIEEALNETVVAIKEDAKERQRAGGKAAGRGRPRKKVPETIREPKRERESSARIADLAGTNQRYVEQARVIDKRAPEKLSEVIAGKKSKYKTSFVWDKVKHNFGHYNSVRHEFLLVCTRGSCTPDVKELHDSVVTLERPGRHSEKPEYFRDLIDKLYPHGKRIELFARKQAEGWDAYGFEADSCTDGKVEGQISDPQPDGEYPPGEDLAVGIVARIRERIQTDGEPEADGYKPTVVNEVVTGAYYM